MRVIASFIVGLIGGGLLVYFTIMSQMPNQMLTVDNSKLDFEQTIETIQTKAVESGWKVPKVYNIQKSLVDAGYENMTRLHVISLCKPEHAYKVLSNDANKKVSAMMPCRIAVYEDKSGGVKIARMNIAVMSSMFGGVIEEIMGKVSDEEHQMLKGILE